MALTCWYMVLSLQSQRSLFLHYPDMLEVDSEEIHTILWASDLEINRHPSDNLQCVGLLLILFAKQLACMSATIYGSSNIVETTLSRRTLGLSPTVNGTTPITDREVPCA